MNQMLGATISLISKSDIRYVGILHSINQQDSTVALESVRSFGTEGRKKYNLDEIMPSDHIFEFIVFRGSDIKDLQVVNAPPPQQPPAPIPNDPAILSVRNPNPVGYGPQGGPLPQHQQQPFARPPPMQQNFMQQQPLPPQASLQQRTEPEVSQQAKKDARNVDNVTKDMEKLKVDNKPRASKTDAESKGAVASSAPEKNHTQQPKVESSVDGARPQQNQSQRNQGQGQQRQQRPQPNEGNQVASSGGGNASGGNRRWEQVDGRVGNSQVSSGGGRGGRGEGQGRGGQRNNGVREGGNNNGGRPPRRERVQGVPVTVPDSDYDFESANAKFEKSDVKLSKVPNAGAAGGDEEFEDDDEATSPSNFYDKTSSFFDNISCEARDRAEGERRRVRHHEERKLNMETFGQVTIDGNRNRRGGYRGRGRGGYNNGRGGYNNRSNGRVGGGGGGGGQ